MNTIEISYKGNLRTECKHVSSGEIILTDAPVDNKGKGEYFSPTDLLATSLATCILTIIGISADAYGFDIDNTKATVKKVMGTNPRRIAEINIEINFPNNNYSDKEKEIIKHAADNCPVAKSLHPEIKKNIIFNWYRGIKV